MEIQDTTSSRDDQPLPAKTLNPNPFPPEKPPPRLLPEPHAAPPQTRQAHSRVLAHSRQGLQFVDATADLAAHRRAIGTLEKEEEEEEEYRGREADNTRSQLQTHVMA